MTSRKSITPCLWFDGQAEEAAAFYVSLFPDSKIELAYRSPFDWPGGKSGEVILVEFRLMGAPYQALNGGAYTEFNESVSLSVPCADQAEVDRYWDALTADGGAPMQCGWVKDRFGLRWQIVPEPYFEMMRDPDPERRARLMTAMLGMVKLDVAALSEAYRG